jgi:subtilase family serine protease
VLACGGTSLPVKGSKKKSESVWKERNAGIPLSSGGGVSRMFPTPVWQQNRA